MRFLAVRYRLLNLGDVKASTVFRNVGIAAAIISIVWAFFSLHIEGRTGFGHFKHAGGVEAIKSGLVWVGESIVAGAKGAWGWGQRTASDGANKAGRAADAALEELKKPTPAQRRGEYREIREGVLKKGERKAPGPTVITDGTPRGAEALQQAAAEQRKATAQPPAPRPADKRKTRTDESIRVSERERLDAKLRIRRSQ